MFLGRPGISNATDCRKGLWVPHHQGPGGSLGLYGKNSKKNKSKGKGSYSGEIDVYTFPHFPRDLGSKLCIRIERSRQR